MKTEDESINRPPLFRTYSTDLTGDELLILDVMFECSVTYPMLRTCNFVPQFNARPHSLDDEALKSTLDSFRSRGITYGEDDKFRGHQYLSITPKGGELWAAERQPRWERYCTESYPATIRGRTIMSVKCTTSWVRDDFIRLQPEYPARTKSATINDMGLVHWRDFGQLYIGLASYTEPREWTPKEFDEWLPRHLAHIERVEKERSWWRTVNELQKFAKP
jgi:hypothetical protein